MSCVKSQPLPRLARVSVYISYLDDSGSDKACPVVIVGAVLVPDNLFINLEAAAGMIVERLIPEEKLEQFEEFHSAELYFGQGIFGGIDETTRFKAIKALLSYVNHIRLPVVYSAVDKKALAQAAYGGTDPLDLAFRMCALGVERWITDNDNEKLCLLIMDETKNGALKNAIRTGFKALRGKLRPPAPGAHRLLHVHDDMYFGDSRDSVGIQIADLCNYFLMHKLVGKRDTDEFYTIYCRNLVCSKAEPEWGQLQGIFREHDDSDV